MRVVEARLARVRLPLVHEFQTSSHRKSSLEHILVRLRGDDSRVAWGEIASPSHPYFGAETVESCWSVASTYLLPALVGAHWERPADAAATWSLVRGNNFAKAGVEAAVWSLYSASRGISLANALGGTATEVVAGVSLGIEPTIDDLLVQVRAQVASGYRRVKLKIAPGWDVEPVRAVRAEFPHLDLHVDANAAYRPVPEHVAALTALDDFGLTMLEQPFGVRDFVGHAALQARLATPICLDESIETVDDLQTALRLDAARVINIKVSRMGGLGESVAAHDAALAAGIPVWCGGMHEFGVGRAANIALSSLPGFTLPSDVSGSDKYYSRDVTTEPILAIDGVVSVPTGAGLGVEIDEEWVAQNTVHTADFAV
jgi:O-succinylbenzoate synthase